MSEDKLTVGHSRLDDLNKKIEKQIVTIEKMIIDDRCTEAVKKAKREVLEELRKKLNGGRWWTRFNKKRRIQTEEYADGASAMLEDIIFSIDDQLKKLVDK